jgi:hypothetical protein
MMIYLKNFVPQWTMIFDGFDLPAHVLVRDARDAMHSVNWQPVQSKIKQLISYLEKVYNASNRIVEVGSAYNLIRDEELKARCSDLLSATDHFDRVINQATQVLEELFRTKFPEHKNLIGNDLVNAIVNNDPSKSILKFSGTGAEQQGYAMLMRGIVMAFRNPSHHRFLQNVTREQALQICAFIDNMLNAIEVADVQTS